MGCVNLNIDPKKQDELATWAEYVHFEFWWLASYERVLERAAPMMKREWEKYHAQGIFTNTETLDVLHSDEFLDKLDDERDQAAERFCDLLETNSGGIAEAKFRPTAEFTEEMTNQAEEEYDRVGKKWAATAALIQTGYHDKYKVYLKNHKALFQWTLDQLHQIGQGGRGPPTREDSQEAKNRRAECNNSSQTSKGKRKILQDPTAIKQGACITTGMQRLGTTSTVMSPGEAARQSDFLPTANDIRKRIFRETELGDSPNDNLKEKRASSSSLQANSGVSTIVERMDITPSSLPSGHPNPAKRGRKSPASSPSAKTPQDSRRPKRSIDKQAHSGETVSIMCQGASASQDSTDNTPVSATMVGVGEGTSLTARDVSETKAVTSRERPRHTTGEGCRDQGDNEHQSSAFQEDKAQDSEPGPVNTRRKRKRDPTAEEIEASIKRKKSLRTLERKDYKV